MEVVRVVSKVESLKVKFGSDEVFIKGHSVNNLSVKDWLEFKNFYEKPIEQGFFYPEDESLERKSIETFRSSLIDGFSLMGAPEVIIKLEAGRFSTKFEEMEAKKWLLQEELDQKSKALLIGNDANSIAREAKLIAKESLIETSKQTKWARRAFFVSIVAFLFSIKDLIALVLRWFGFL